MIHDLVNETRYRVSTMLDERRPLDGMLGLPALFTVILLGFMVLTSHETVDLEQQSQMEADAQTYLDQGRFMEARLTAMRLARNGTENQKAVLIEAKALRGMGKEKDAMRLLSHSAPLERPGYAPAHVLQAAIVLSQTTPDPAVAKRHIENALQADPSNEDGLELAARFAAIQRDWKAALRFLTKINLEKRADLMLMKATALQYSGMKDDAIKCAQEAEQALRNVDKGTVGADRIRFSIAVSLSLQRRFEDAVKWVVGTNTGKPDQEERQVLGGIYLSWSRHLKDQAMVDKLQVLQLLEKGIQISPESQDLIMAFLHDCEEFSTDTEERKRHVERVLGEGGIATSFLHYYMGVQDWKNGERDSARTHFELASSLNPGFSVISNNLAMAIASVSSKQDELEKALSMMDELLKREPENPFYLDTRGHVHAKLGRFKEAVGDFERALPKARNQDSTHAKLADLYQHLGMQDLAAQHRNASLARMQPSKPATAIQ
ncbi:MAG: hypothetical protein ACO1TE_10350 [Prosthecobacter sp.]